MLNIKKNSDTIIILLHEIYGINQFIKVTSDHFSRNGYDVFCPNIIKAKQPFNYDQEKNDNIHMLKGKHGFCDPFNKNYCEHSCQEAEILVDNFLKKIRKECS